MKRYPGFVFWATALLNFYFITIPSLHAQQSQAADMQSLIRQLEGEVKKEEGALKNLREKYLDILTEKAHLEEEKQREENRRIAQEEKERLLQEERQREKEKAIKIQQRRKEKEELKKQWEEQRQKLLKEKEETKQKRLEEKKLKPPRKKERSNKNRRW